MKFDATTVLLATLVGALFSGLAAMWTAYNGWRKNHLDSASAQNSSMSTIINEAMTLVDSLRTEVARVSAQNADLRMQMGGMEQQIIANAVQINQQATQIATLTSERDTLHERISRLTALLPGGNAAPGGTPP